MTLDNGRGRHRKYRPYAFTEQGVAMLSGVLHSHCAVHVNIEIMRAFVRQRRLLQSNAQLAQKLDALETKYDASSRRSFRPSAITTERNATETRRHGDTETRRFLNH